jgi:hypothetical protein
MSRPSVPPHKGELYDSVGYIYIYSIEYTLKTKYYTPGWYAWVIESIPGLSVMTWPLGEK